MVDLQEHKISVGTERWHIPFYAFVDALQYQINRLDQEKVSVLATGSINMSGYRITNLGNPLSPLDACNLATVQTLVSTGGTQSNISVGGLGAEPGSLSGQDVVIASCISFFNSSFI